MFASRSLAETEMKPLLYGDTRLEAGRLALRRGGRSYVITWRVTKDPSGGEHLTERKAHHPDDLVEAVPVS